MNYYQDHSQNGISVLSTTGAWLVQGHQNHVLPPNTHSFVGFVGNEFANDGRLQQVQYPILNYVTLIAWEIIMT